ncbi:uncharacterized protein METZ01_LOCUS212802 [marine metagenome]|uniref:N-acetyltransferase domain-containing protein n=1 Tax=marine metagenome TaxID=408172 RepID=A0A382FA31_9ZZZZ|tara:strand:- start:17 stop:562 length:546 start_codon:yes stop_codon:yes gene_type:complete
MDIKDDIIRMLTIDDIDEWLDQCAIVDAESGEDGIYFGPYSRKDKFSKDKIKKKTLDRWTRNMDIPNWRKAWGIFHNQRIVGNAQIQAGELPTGLHRVEMSIVILKEYRNKGLGKRLLEVLIDWCNQQESIHWIDLGVFSGNNNAMALFKKVGFQKVGYIEDCWLIDGKSISETLMSINVK